MSSTPIDISNLVAKALELDSSKLEPSKWNLDAVLKFAVDVAGLVKASSASSKQQNFELLMKVVDAVLQQLQEKEVAGLNPQDSSTVVARWASLKASVDVTLPVVFSYTSHLSVPPVVGNCFSCFCLKAVEVEEFVKLSLPVVEKTVEAALPVVEEVAVAAAPAVVAKVEGELAKVEAVVNT